MSTTSQLLSEYIKKTSGQVSSSLRESEQQRFDAIKDIVKNEKARRNEITEIKPSEILREFKAGDTLEQYAKAENQMKKFGITDKSVQQFVKEEEERRTSSLKGLEERFTRERKAKEQETKELLTKEEEEQTITNAENSVLKGSSPTLNYAFKKVPARISNAYTFNDINIISSTEKEPDFEKTEAYFTEKDIQNMYDNGTFENAGITKEKVKKYLNIVDKTGMPMNGIMPVKGAQELMYEYLQTPESSNLRTAYKIEMKDPKQQNSFEQMIQALKNSLATTQSESTNTQTLNTQSSSIFQYPNLPKRVLDE